jgi:hypothetical protein
MICMTMLRTMRGTVVDIEHYYDFFTASLKNIESQKMGNLVDAD